MDSFGTYSNTKSENIHGVKTTDDDSERYQTKDDVSEKYQTKMI